MPPSTAGKTFPTLPTQVSIVEPEIAIALLEAVIQSRNGAQKLIDGAMDIVGSKEFDARLRMLHPAYFASDVLGDFRLITFSGAIKADSHSRWEIDTKLNCAGCGGSPAGKTLYEYGGTCLKTVRQNVPLKIQVASPPKISPLLEHNVWDMMAFRWNSAVESKEVVLPKDCTIRVLGDAGSLLVGYMLCVDASKEGKPFPTKMLAAAVDENDAVCWPEKEEVVRGIEF